MIHASMPHSTTARAAAAGAQASVGGVGALLSIGDFLELAEPSDAMPDAVPAHPARHAHAATGKTLPDDPAATDPLLAWLPPQPAQASETAQPSDDQPATPAPTDVERAPDLPLLGAAAGLPLTVETKPALDASSVHAPAVAAAVVQGIISSNPLPVYAASSPASAVAPAAELGTAGDPMAPIRKGGVTVTTPTVDPANPAVSVMPHGDESPKPSVASRSIANPRSVSLGTIAQMLGGPALVARALPIADGASVVPASVRAALVMSGGMSGIAPIQAREQRTTVSQRVDDVVGAAPVLPEPMAAATMSPGPMLSPTPGTALPPMPATVARFLAAVATTMRAPANEPPASNAAMIPVAAATALPPGAPQAPIQVAGRLFADAIHAAFDRESQRVSGDPALGVAAPASVAASSPVTIDRAAVDMTQAHWPAKMIDRIELLRDAADAQDTRIRLIPDALGPIDVTMRREGTTVHVHLSAQQAGTHAMLVEAQPRLSEIGEARGLKLAPTIDHGSGQGAAQQHRATATPPAPTRPAAALQGDPIDDDNGDLRIA